MKKTIMKKIAAYLLTLAMLAACIPVGILSVSAAEDIDDHLIIHYDFEGNTWAERLADKAGSTDAEKTNLYALNGAKATVSNGKVSSVYNSSTQATTLDGIYQVEKGVISTKSTSAVHPLVTDITEEIKKIHKKDDPTDLTVYMRVNVTDGDTWSDWNILFDMRNTADTTVNSNGNRVLFIEARKDETSGENGLRIDTAGYSTKLSKTNIAQSDGWMDIAIVRTAASLPTAGDIFTFYAVVNGSWVQAGQSVSANGHDTADSSKLVLSLFGGANQGNGNKSACQYDDIRIYDMALSFDQLTEMKFGASGTAPDYDVDAPVTTPAADLSSNLLIHYDFEGGDWATVLADKAGDVKTNLSVLDGINATVENGAVTNVLTDASAIEAIFKAEGGVLSAVGSEKTNVIAGGFTADSAAIHVNDTPTELTLYLRVKVTDWAGWNTIFTMRTTSPAPAYTTANNRIFNIEFDSATNVNMYAGYQKVTSSSTVLDSDGDGWVDIAVVRTPAAAAAGFDTLTLYAMTGTAWSNLGSATYDFKHNTMDSSTLLFGLFGGANGGKEGNYTNVAYDDIRIYNKALTASELASVSADVAGGNVNMLGVQRSLNDNSDGSYDLRLVATLKGENWKKAGFKVSLTSEKTVYLPVTAAYTSILAEGDGGMNSVITAPQGSYLIAVTLTDIPASYDAMSIDVTPYAVEGSNTANGKDAVISLKNGGIVSVTWASDKTTVAGKYPTLVDFYMYNDMTQAVRDDQALCEALVVRMGQSAVLKVGSSSVLWDGYIQKLDESDYSKTATQSGNAINVPADFANRYFGVNTYSGTVDIKALAESRGYKVLVEGTLVILTDPNVAEFTDGGTDGKYTNAVYKARMAQFFTDSALLDPSNNTEQSRVVIEDAVNYYPEDSTDFAQPIYTNYYSPAVLSVERSGQSVLYAANERCLTKNGAEPSTVTVIHRSTDGGKTWTIIDSIGKLNWASFFEVNDSNLGTNGLAANKGIYLFGNLTGYMVIYKLDETTGKFTMVLSDLCRDKGNAAAITNPAVIDGVLYLALDYTVASCPLTSDITNAANWEKTQDPSDLVTKEWLNSNLGYTLGGAGGDGSILEGNVVKGKDGKIYVFWRLESAPKADRAVMLQLSDDRTTLQWSNSQNQKDAIVTMPTTISRFGIQYDETLGLYICLSNWWTVDDHPRARNVVGLSVSSDLKTWTKIDTVLVDRAMVNEQYSCLAHAFQYFAWDIDGDDIVLTVRETQGFANTFHDGKYFTFYRLSDFRTLIDSKLEK